MFTSISRFEVLLSEVHPALHQHITEHGIPSVLYVSQWLMTVFATPFPSHFSARIIDIMLLVGVEVGVEGFVCVCYSPTKHLLLEGFGIDGAQAAGVVQN